MTVSSSTRKVIYTGNGVTTVWPFTFPVYRTTDLSVQLLDIATNTITNFTAYTVTGIGPGSSGGAVTISPALANTKKVIIQRTVPYTQLLELLNQGGFYPETLEEALDFVVMQVQQLADDTSDVSSRAIKVPLGETGFETSSAASRASKLFAFNALGEFLAYDFTSVALGIPGPGTVGYDELNPTEMRLPLLAAATIYVRDDGNDSNTGLVNNAAGAFLTLQKAYNWAQERDTRGFNVTCIATGTFAAGITMQKPLVGSGKFILQNGGNLTISAPYVIDANYFAQVQLEKPNANQFNISSNAVGGTCLSAKFFSQIDLVGAINFAAGNSTAIHVYATRYGQINMPQTYDITGGGANHLQASHSGNIRLPGGGTINIRANQTYTDCWMYALANSDITATGGLTVTYNGFSVTAVRFVAHAAIIQWISAYGGRDGPPGNSPGLEIEGGYFLEGEPPFGVGGTTGEMQQGSFDAAMGSIPVVVNITSLKWMPARIEFMVGGATFPALGTGTWERKGNTNYSQSSRPKSADATVIGDNIFNPGLSILFYPSFTTAITGTVTSWGSYSFQLTLAKIGSPTGTITIWWKAYRH